MEFLSHSIQQKQKKSKPDGLNFYVWKENLKTFKTTYERLFLWQWHRK
jgi:hypothetical protein